MDDRAGRFLDLSVLLTGFGRVQLLGTGMLEHYLRAVDDVLPAGFLDELLAAYGALPAGDREAAAGPAIFDDPKLGPVARNLILLWYCGTWTELPEDWRGLHGTSPLDTHRVVSPASYLAGLQWVAAGAHPVGARQQGYGAWAVPPEAVGA
jgi:hypothetical protein